MSPSDDLPFWTYEELASYDYEDYLLQLEDKYHLSYDRDDIEYPPVEWESGCGD